MCIATVPLKDSLKLRRSDIAAIPRHHAAPLGLAAVLFGFVCYKYAAPTELAMVLLWTPRGRCATRKP